MPAPEHFLRRLHVLSDLRAEFIGAGKAQLIAKPVYEPDGDGLSVNILAEVEKMRLEGQVGISEGWIVSQIGRASVCFAVHFGLDHIDACSGRRNRRHSDIGGRKAEADSSLSAGNYGAAYLEEPSQQSVGFLDIPAYNHLPDGRAAHDGIIHPESGDDLDLKAVLLPQLFEKGDIALAAVPKTVIMADNNRPGADLFNENGLHKFAGRHPRELMIEGDDYRGVDPAACDQIEFVPVRGNE